MEKKFFFFESFYGTIIVKKTGKNENLYFLKFNKTLKNFKKKIDKFGKIPLPPYIKKRGLKKNDFKDYQTIFAEKEGAVAAPTASLHFTSNLIEKIKEKKISIIKITLHINGGTFYQLRQKIYQITLCTLRVVK